MSTRSIKNCRDSMLFKGCSPLQDANWRMQLDRKSPAIRHLS